MPRALLAAFLVPCPLPPPVTHSPTFGVVRSPSPSLVRLCDAMPPRWTRLDRSIALSDAALLGGLLVDGSKVSIESRQGVPKAVSHGACKWATRRHTRLIAYHRWNRSSASLEAACLHPTHRWID